MAETYRRSYLTIAATSALDDEGGCFFQQPPERTCHLVHPGRPEDGHPPVYTRVWWKHPDNRRAEPFRTLDLGSFPLLTRAWAYQELFLSPRVVHYTENELFFDCELQSSCECSGDSWIRPRDECLIDTPAMWNTIVSKYSGRALTYEKDKLPALSGTAKLTPQWKSGQQYLAGLWEKTLLNDLLWFAPDPGAFRPRTWRAPSWSWASVEGDVFLKHPDDCETHAIIQSASCTPSGLDATGQVSSGYIVISGPVFDGILGPGPGEANRRTVNGLLGSSPCNNLITDYDFEEQGQGQIPVGSNLTLLWIRTVHFILGDEVDQSCLVLRALDSTLKKYVRVGTFHGVYQSGEFEGLVDSIGGARQATITIV